MKISEVPITDEMACSYGVFPLRGKVANPRDANHEQIMKTLLQNSTNEIQYMIASGKYKDYQNLTAVSSLPLTDGTTPGFTQFHYN